MKPAAIQRNFNFKIEAAKGNELTPKILKQLCDASGENLSG